MEALHEWHEFYLLVGTAAATVLALLFVAVSLGAGVVHGAAPRRRTAIEVAERCGAFA